MAYLGIDLGTSGLRALLVDAQGTPIASAEHHYAAQNPHRGWSEQDPQQWVDALDHAMMSLGAEHSDALRALRGIGVAGHMHGATLLDDAGRVLRPCILWNDTRSQSQATRLDQTAGVRDLSGNIVFAGFTAPKLEWVRENEPETYAKVAKVLLPAAYMNFHLTGDYVADMSDSAGTSWLDVGARDWSDRLLDAGNMRRDQMPRLVEGSAAAGQLRDDLRQKWGIAGPVTVAGGAGDNAAAACGIGALNEGVGFVSLGTSGVLLAARNGYRPAPETALHTFCHAVPDRWYQMGVMLSATDSLNWLSSITGKSPADLTKALGHDLRAPSTLRFLPYLSGERTPHNDAEIRGAFTGLSVGTTIEDMTQAVLEGVAYGLRDSYDALCGTGATFESLIAIGGGSASRYWLRVIASVLGVPLTLPAKGEFGAALGAARLGMTAAGDASVDEIMGIPAMADQIDPDPALMAGFAEGFDRFRATYPAIKSVQ
jgi:xylulokinase